MTIDDNPFERWDLDPGDDRRKLTEAMRKKSQQVSSEEREDLQRDWRALTSDATARARWALLAHPRVCDEADLWAEAEKVAAPPSQPDLDSLEPTIDDGLVLPLMSDKSVDADPPFLPRYLEEDR